MKLLNKVELLLKEFKTPRTMNQAMDRIWTREVGNKKAISRGPRFYTHLNKLPTILEREGLIAEIDKIVGPTGKLEKVWVVI